MTKNYICHTPYLRKHTPYDRDFWDTYVKWWHLQMLISFFKKKVVMVVKGQRMTQNDKKFCFLSLTLYLKNRTLYDFGFWYTSVKSYLQQFFHFFKILIFLVCKRVKGQKITHNYQFQSVTSYISRTVDQIKIFGTQM